MRRFFLILIYLSINFCVYSQDCDSLIKQGDIYYANYDFDKAISYYFECQRTNTNNYDATYKCALAYYQLQNYPEAILYFQASHLINPEEPMPLFYLAKSHKLVGETKEGLEYLVKLVAKNPDNFYFRLQLAEEYASSGYHLNAIEEYWKLLKSKPNSGSLLGNLAEEYYELEGYHIADSLTTVAYKSPTNRTVKLLRVMTKVKYKVEQDSQVISIVNELNEKGDSSLYFMKLKATSLRNTNQYQNCIDLGNWIVAKSKPNKDEYIHYLLGDAYSAIDQPDSSLLHLKLAIEAGISSNVPKYYEMQAKIYADEDKIPEAISAYQKLLMFDEKPSAVYALAILSDDYYKDKTIALRYFQKYLKLAPSSDSDQYSYAKNRITAIKEILHQSQ